MLTDYSTIMVNETTGRKIAELYMSAPNNDERRETIDAYRAFAFETEQQYKELGNVLSLGVQSSDPYSSYQDMRADVSQGRLDVLSTASSGSHPYMTDSQNDMFRAVHDFHGHYMTGRDFSRHGEEAAWTRHSLMYSPLARRAMTTETRGQNSAFIFALGGKTFPTQKLTLLPEWVTFG